MKFEPFNKIPRLNRECVITEKLDGTNAQVYIEKHDDPFTIIERLSDEKYQIACIDGYRIFAGSRKRWLTTSSKGDMG